MGNINHVGNAGNREGDNGPGKRGGRLGGVTGANVGVVYTGKGVPKAARPAFEKQLRPGT